MSKASDIRLAEIAQMILNGNSVNRIREITGLKEDSIRRYIDWAKTDGLLPEDVRMRNNSFLIGDTDIPVGVESGSLEKLDKTVDNKGMCITTASTSIKTVEDALARSGVDLGDWEVDKYVISSRGVETKKWKYEATGKDTEPLWTVKVWLKRKLIDVAKAAKEVSDAFSAIDTEWSYTARKKESGIMCEIGIPDLHIGKALWSGKRSEIVKHFEIVSDELLSMAAAQKPEQILIPIGNDLIHIDNMDGTTTKGTSQDIDSKPQLMFESAVQMFIGFIRKARYIAPVKVVIISGNHDELTSFHVGVALKAYFHDCKDVEIDNGISSRKYVQWGTVLLGFVHGGKEDVKPEKLPLLMAVEQPKAWSKTTHREWHLGDKHHRKDVAWRLTNSDCGVHCRILPSLCATDSWHHKKGYVGQPRVADLYIWSKDRGFVGMLSTVPVVDKNE